MKVHVPQNIDSELLHSVYLQLAANNLSVCNTFGGSTPPLAHSRSWLGLTDHILLDISIYVN